MSEDRLDALLRRLPDIATAVNSFNSEAIQKEAFAALLAAYNGEVPATSSVAEPGIDQSHKQDLSAGQEASSPPEVPNGRAEGRQQRKARKAGGKDSFRFMRDLDLRPEGKQSFADFIEEKKPASNEDKFAAVVYYLQQVLELQSVSGDHVGSAFRMTQGWREPADVKAALRVASARKGTIDTSNPDDIRITPQGRNFVEHDLPPQVKAKK